MAKKSGDEKGSRGAKASGNLTEGKAIRNSVFDGKISKTWGLYTMMPKAT